MITSGFCFEELNTYSFDIPRARGTKRPIAVAGLMIEDMSKLACLKISRPTILDLCRLTNLVALFRMFCAQKSILFVFTNVTKTRRPVHDHEIHRLWSK